MSKKLMLITLSLALLLYPTQLPQAHSLNGRPTGEESVVTQAPQPSTDAGAPSGEGSVLPPGALKTGEPPAGAPRGAVAASVSNPSKATGNGAGKKRSAGANRPTFGGSKEAGRAKRRSAFSRSAALHNGRGARNEILIRTINANYLARTGQSLIIRSGYRTAAGQARAIYGNLRLYGVNYVLSLYRRRAAIREIVNAYRLNRRRPRRALMAMTRVIETQVARGVIISRHMLGRAFDVRSWGPNGARLSVLRTVVNEMGGRVSVERNHYHVEI